MGISPSNSFIRLPNRSKLSLKFNECISSRTLLFWAIPSYPTWARIVSWLSVPHHDLSHEEGHHLRKLWKSHSVGLELSEFCWKFGLIQDKSERHGEVWKPMFSSSPWRTVVYFTKVGYFAPGWKVTPRIGFRPFLSWIPMTGDRSQKRRLFFMTHACLVHHEWHEIWTFWKRRFTPYELSEFLLNS